MAHAIPHSGPSRLADLSTAHPMDSSRLFLALLNLVRSSDASEPSGPARHVIAVPILRRLLSALHFRDVATLKHSRRVGLISIGIAGRLGWEEDDLRIMEIAALMHDIGKIGIPDHILRKPGKLTPDEAEYIAVYHRVALSLLQACQIHPDVAEIVSQSHGINEEHLNGRNPLSLGSRILAVADAYDSLTTRQCYRAPYDRWEAMQILEEQSGKQFDRNVVAALGRWLDSPDAGRLADERAAEVSIHVNAPVDMETRMNANQLCQAFNHLYLLESLYDAFYVVDASRQIVIWSSGAADMFGRPAQDILRKKWSRQLVTLPATHADPLETVFQTGQPICHAMTIQADEETVTTVDVQSIPIQGENGEVWGVVELVCNGRESKRHRGQFRSLQIAATRDPLTGVFNRGELERRLREVHEAYENDSAQPYSVVFMDLDHFKSINDRLSHAVGDRVLIECARMLQDELYSGELVGRYGGEEFVIICPETTVEAAIDRAERLRRTVMECRFAERDDLRVTASFGVAEVHPGESVDKVVSNADQALYESKRLGRNRTSESRYHSTQSAGHRNSRKSSDFPAYSATIVTHIVSEMLQLKLTGFVEERRARILSVDSRHLLLQIGSPGMFFSWTKNQVERLPVKVRIDINETSVDQGGNSIKRLALNVTIDPVGRMNDEELFQTRASMIVEQLRAHLMV